MDASAILKQTAHRPYPLPVGPWIMQQTWRDLLFAHWPVDAEHVRAAMPHALRAHLDTFEGSAWVGVIPLRMYGVSLRGAPGVPTATNFAELNVRTYVTVDGKPGVYFFSLDAESRLAVMGAKLGFGLNYKYAKMKVRTSERGQVEYYSSRKELPKPAEFEASYAAESAKIFSGAPGTLDHFLTERYCLYTSHGPHIGRANIHHAAWPLQRAKVTIKTNSMAMAAGIVLPEKKPLLHFAKELDVLVWPLERASR
jgi:uncharacterized protein YqjF (DUF2071 family)